MAALWAEIQNLLESIRLVDLVTCDSYILIIRRDSRASLYILCDLSLLGYRNHYSEECVGLGCRAHFLFSIYRTVVSGYGDLCVSRMAVQIIQER